VAQLIRQLQNATRICDTKFGAMYLREGNDAFRIVAMHNAPPSVGSLISSSELVIKGVIFSGGAQSRLWMLLPAAYSVGALRRADPFMELAWPNSLVIRWQALRCVLRRLLGGLAAIDGRNVC